MEYKQPYEDEPEYIPHYDRYQEKLKDEFIEALEKISGVFYKTPHWLEAENPEDFIGPWVGEEITIPNFISAIVAKGLKKEVSEYVDFEINVLTIRIKDHPYSQGKVTYFASDHSEGFWEEDYSSEEEQERMEELQSLAVEQIHREWLIGFRRMLFTGLPDNGRYVNTAIKKPTKPEITQAARALFYFYSQESNEFPKFEEFLDPDGKELGKGEAIKREFLDKWPGVSYEKFEQVYNLYSYDAKLRQQGNQIEHLKKAIKLLENKGFLKGKTKAEHDLKVAELNQ